MNTPTFITSKVMMVYEDFEPSQEVSHDFYNVDKF
jgi:hypothetical protein